ncbi:MAG TPA: hypothetical protein PLK80_04915, partial [bacterium]|nr:hypothetical protein [bacterium]
PNPSPSVAGTSADGVFTFYYVPKTPDGAHYRVSVAVGGNFTFPSLIPNSEMPKQYRVDERSKGNPFVTPLPGEFEDAGVVESGDLVYYPLNFDIPVDPPVIELLAVTKTADKKNATIGDIVRYTVRVSNSGSWPVNDITVTDILPHGMQYIDGSTTLSGAAADPARPASMTLAWSVTSLAAGGYFEISYSTVVGVDSKRGDGKNTAYAQGTLGAKTVSSNTAYYTVTIKEGVFTSNGTIVGKVFVDSDGDGMQSRGEPGVSGVAIYMEDGARIVTGTDGKYSVIGVTPGLHVLKIEAKTLPAGISISSLSTNRFAGDPDSQFIDMVSGGIMNADFTVSGDKESADRRNMETREKAATSGQAAAAGRTEFVYVPLEEEISSMTPDLDILYPEDGSVSSAANTNITVKAPLAAKVYLFLNDEPVSSKRVGKKITESELEIAIYQYIGIQLAPGAENAIRAETRDEDGNITSEKEIRITAAGLPAKIEVKPEKTEIIADGASKARVSASVYDDKGLPVAYEGIATVETTSGEIDTKDADASMDGVQVLYSGGAARFDVKAPRQAGEAVITVAFGELQGSAKVHFTPDLGDNLSVGLVEFRFGSGKAGGDTELIRSSDGWFDRGGYAGARGALFTKRKIGDDSLLTLSYDSHKSKRPDLFFNSLRNPDAEDQYPIYGDDSVTSFEAQSREKLYLRLDRRKSHLLFGDFETGFNETKLSAYSRSFNGLKIGMNTDKYRLSAFETHTDQSQVVDAIPGRGVSGYYYLSAAPIMDGSETVAVEIRDRLRPEAALNRDTLSRWSEYSIDYETGAILLKDPLPSYDEDLNPVYLIVSYETEGGGNTYYIYGARLRFKLNDRLGVGFTGVTQEAETSDYHLWGMDFDYKLHKLTTLKYEFAETKSLFNIDNILALKNGGGWSFELKSDALERTKITAYWRNTRSYFGNMSAVDAQRGMEKKGLEFSFLKNRNTTLAGKFFTERDSVNYMDHRLSSILLKRTIRNMKFESELLRESSNDNFIITNTDRTRYPFDISERTPSKTTAARFSLTGNIRPRLALTLEHQQDIQDNNFNVSSAKLDYKLKGAGHLYARREFWRLDGSRSWRNVLGVETPIARDTSAFNEYRLEGGADGRRVQRAIGVRNKFALNDRVSGSVSLEKLNTVKGAEMQRDPDAFAVTAGTEFVFMRDVKMTARAEYRDSTLDTSRLAELGLAAKMGTDYSLLLRQRWSNTGYSTGAQRTTTGSMVGVAYRPAHNNRFNAFARIEFKRDRSSPVVSDSTPSARIYSIEGVYHPSKSFSLTGKYAAKISKTDLFRSYTDMVAGRFTYDLTSRFDIGLEARTLRSRSINSQSIGGSAELGYKCLKNIWLTTGYSFDDFDSDLAGDSYWGKGPYISIKFKFD